jgi:hypothetical protein
MAPSRYPLRHGPSLGLSWTAQQRDQETPPRLRTLTSQPPQRDKGPSPAALAQPTQASQVANARFVLTSGQALRIRVRSMPVAVSASQQLICRTSILSRASLVEAKLGTCHSVFRVTPIPPKHRGMHMSYDTDTAWLADQPVSLAGLQIRLKTVKHKSLTRCPAFVHTATPQ